MTRRTTVFAAFAIVFAALLIAAAPARAITVIPPSINLGGQRSEKVTNAVKVFNETAQSITFTASTANFIAKDEEGDPEFLPETNQEDLAGWIQVGRGPYTLQSGQRMDVPFEVKIPENADPGGHYATIFFTQENTTANVNASQITVNLKVGTNIFLSVAGEVHQAASVSSFSTIDGKKHFNHLPVTFVTRVVNSGNVHIAPIGNVTIRNMLGGTTMVLPFNTTKGYVLPNSARKFTSTWEKADTATKHSFFQEFAHEWQNFAFGSYTAELALTYGTANDQTLNATVRIFVFPWHVLLASVLILIFAVWLIVFLVKRYNRWIIKKAEKRGPKTKQDKA